ncbi:hypothetical protein R1A27_32335 (plasmid) [Methylobacterium sp. NMS12]|uniref:hypothetical protein n=1 Tax=Methylobacterium sp. NMS12 TaxID=3079766 RepID=UPI003F8817F5
MRVTAIGCGLILAGLAAEHRVAHRWLAAERPARFDAFTILAFVLPAFGLALIAAATT